MRRYKDTVGIIKSENKDGRDVRRYETIYYPDIRKKMTDKYISSKKWDRWDIYAARYYNDPTMWWVIAKANNSADGSLFVEPGVIVRIPYPINDLELLVEENQY